MVTTVAFVSSPPPSIGSRFRALIRTLRLSFILLTFFFFSTVVTAEISYSDHCKSTVPESVATSLSTSVPYSYFHFDSHYFSGADELLPSSSHNSFSFSAVNIYDTQSPGVFNIHASLNLLTRNFTDFRRLPMVQFSLEGFWSEETGKVCMVGNGQRKRKEGIQIIDLSAVFKLHYFPRSSNLTTAMVSGSLESLDPVGSNGYFSPVKMSAYAPHDYQYSLVIKTESFGDQLDGAEEAVGFSGNWKICGLLNGFERGNGFPLEYASECPGNNCNPSGGSVGYLPRFMFLNHIECSEGGLLHLYLTFSNFSYYHVDGEFMEPELMLVGEGLWEKKRNLLKMVACRVLSSKKNTTEDCTIRVGLWFPKYLSITNRSFVSGRMWSKGDSKDPNYFKMISFDDMGFDINMGRTHIAGTSYKYTKVETLRKTCSNMGTGKSTGKMYPDINSPTDMRFDISVKNADGESNWGSATPVSLGHILYDDFLMGDGNMPLPALAELKQSLWNISYRITYYYRNASWSQVELIDISAEGIYNTETGALCMTGCRSSMSPSDNYLKKSNGTDCSVTIDIQRSPLHPKEGEHTTGTIKSTRPKTDPLYFKPLEVSSYGLYTSQIVETISRMDIEIMMVLVSLTLMCVFTGFQLFHVKKHPHVLPSISLTMLVVLTVGHMVPLVLNFETFIQSRNKQYNLYFQSGGWLKGQEVEVTVRVMTMITFLLQCRLLQLVWSSRSAETIEVKVGEKRTIQLCLPLYVTGALVAWFVHTRSQKPLQQGFSFPGEVRGSLWEEMISYVGVLLDGFLLPQIILNLFLNSKEKSLALVFYVGTTVVRATPHLYDAYRTHYYVPYLADSYIFGNPYEDFYSNAWDIVVPCGGVLFAFILCLQQCFGSTCIVPSRFRDKGGYEMVPVETLATA